MSSVVSNADSLGDDARSDGGNSQMTSQSQSQGSKNKSKKDARVVVPRFLTKTYEMMMEPRHRDLVDWNREGTVIVIKNVHGFSEKVLPQYFKHSNYASFVRQLNMYGFTRALNLPQAFKHPLFQRGKQGNLALMKRKSSQPKQDLAALGNKHKAELERALQDIKVLRERQEKIDEDVVKLKGQNAHLDEENTMLWKVVDEARDRQQLLAKKMKQIMVFLYSAFMKKDGQARLASLSETLPKILDEAKAAGVEIEELENSAFNADDLLDSSTLSDDQNKTLESVPAEHPVPHYQHIPAHRSSGALPGSGGPNRVTPTSSSSTTAASLSRGSPPGPSHHSATANNLVSNQRALTGAPHMGQHQSQLSHQITPRASEMTSAQPLSSSGCEEGNDNNDLIRLDTALTRLPTLGGDDLLNFDGKVAATPPPASSSYAAIKQLPPAPDMSKMDSMMSFGLLDDVKPPAGPDGISSGAHNEAADLVRADSLARSASLQSYLDLIESSKVNKNANVTDDLHKHLDIAKELDRYMADQDNTLQRINTIESHLSGVHDTGHLLDDDDDDDDFFKEEPLDSTIDSNNDNNNNNNEYGYVSPSKRRIPDTPSDSIDGHRLKHSRMG